MRQKPDAIRNSEHDLGLAYGKALRQVANTDPKVRQALLLDVLGEDRTLLAPLRHMVEAPDFSDLINETSPAARVARKDALLHELASWCNKSTLGRLEAFLLGALGLPEACHAHSSSEEEASGPSAGDSSGFTHKTHSGHSGEPVASTKTSDSSSGKTDGRVHSAAESIASLSEKAYAASLAGDHHRAIELLSKALRIDPAKPDLYMQRGCLHAKNQDPGSAIQDFTSVLRLAPDNHEARAQRGQAHALMGATEKAIDDWQLAASGGHMQARQWLSRQVEDDCHRLLASSQHHQAMRLLNIAIRVAPANANLFFLRGQVNQAIMHHGLAISDFNTAIRLEPYHALAYALRGISHKNGGNRSGALRDWRSAVRLGYSKASEWLLELEDFSDSSDSENCDPTQVPKSCSSREDSSVAIASRRRHLAIAMLAGGLMFIGIVHDRYLRNVSASPEPAQKALQSGSGAISITEDRLSAARMHSKSAV